MLAQNISSGVDTLDKNLIEPIFNIKPIPIVRSSLIELTILDCEYWSKGQYIVKISEDEFISKGINFKKRFMKRYPEYWIYLNVSTSKEPKGRVTIIVDYTTYYTKLILYEEGK